MAPDLSRDFRVRAYECDPYGHLNNTMYLRYRQAADEAAPPRGALLREQIEYLVQLEPGDHVVVEGAFDSAADGYERRSYRFLSAGAAVATASAEWAEPPDADRGTPLGEPPPAPEGAFAIDLPVEWRDVGPGGRANPAALAALAEHGGIRVLAEHGWPMSRCTASGFAIILRRLTIEYTGSARLEDEVRVRTWASDVRRSMATRHYLLSLVATGEEIARLRSLYVWVGLESARPIRIPEAFLEDFAPNFA